MKNRILNIIEDLIDETLTDIHDVKMNMFYTSNPNKVDCKNKMVENLNRLDLCKELIILLKELENDVDEKTVLNDYIDKQLDEYNLEIKSDDKLKLKIASERKKILDFIISNLYKNDR